jgi:hypothetical protein
MITTEKNTLELGQALAYVRNVLDVNTDELEGISPQQRSYLSAMQSRFIELSSKKPDDIFKHIPRCSCNSDFPFLENNLDFFIAFLLIGIDENNVEDHAKITKHLNDCFWCFELFTDVVRDFFYSSQKFNN